jgi:hypothetical protein
VVFSNRLTKMETKMYSSALNGTGEDRTRLIFCLYPSKHRLC